MINCLLVVKCSTRVCFSEVIDLSDESGNLKNLLEHKGDYATQHLKARHSFILIKVDSKCPVISYHKHIMVTIFALYTFSFQETLSSFTSLI